MAVFGQHGRAVHEDFEEPPFDPGHVELQGEEGVRA